MSEGFVGGNGAGTTTLNIITDILDRDKGMVSINGLTKEAELEYKNQFFSYVNTKLDNYLKVCPFIFNWTLVIQRSMNTNIIKPIKVIKYFKVKFLLARKYTSIYEFCFNSFKRDFSECIFVGCSFIAH